MTQNSKTRHVPHLGGIDVGYRLSSDVPDKTKATLILFTPFTTTVDYYLPEFRNRKLCDRVNLLAIEPLGHGETKAKGTESFTYWDSAIMGLQLLDTLGISNAFVGGTSQGGFVAVRMALIAPERIAGVIPIGSSMDGETLRSRELGCWNGPEDCAGLVNLAGNLAVANDFEPGDAYCDFLMGIGYGNTVDKATRDFWAESLRANYQGDEGKRRICMAAVNLAGRDGLHERLPYVKCPVMWLQGDSDVVFSLRNAQEEIQLFKNSVEARLVSFKGGVHFLSWTHAEAMHEEIINFVEAWNGRKRSSVL